MAVFCSQLITDRLQCKSPGLHINFRQDTRTDSDLDKIRSLVPPEQLSAPADNTQDKQQLQSFEQIPAQKFADPVDKTEWRRSSLLLPHILQQPQKKLLHNAGWRLSRWRDPSDWA